MEKVITFFKDIKIEKTYLKSFITTVMTVTMTLLFIVGIFQIIKQPDQQMNSNAKEVVSSIGSRGKEVEAIQRTLRDWGLFDGPVTGYYGTITQEAVKRFQRYRGLPVTGIAGTQTLKLLGISIGEAPSATTANVNLLARIISAEGRGEPYVGQVAIGAVILNRIEHPSFPDTLSGVIYQSGAFTAITDGQFNEPVADSAYTAAREALSGSDPSGGAIYYYNPDKTSNAWIRSRPVIKRIGEHLFCS